MNVFNRTVLTGLAFYAAALHGFAQDDSKAPPQQFFSPDKKHSVRIIHRAMPGSDPDEAFFTLELAVGEKVISRFPTKGYLLEAFWSADGKYVAVNNRRGSDGDYLWVLALADGNAIRVPDDQNTRAVVGRIKGRFPEFSYDILQHRTTYATGWDKPGELHVRTWMSFFNLNDAHIMLDEVYKVAGGKMTSVEQKIEKVSSASH